MTCEHREIDISTNGDEERVILCILCDRIRGEPWKCLT